MNNDGIIDESLALDRNEINYIYNENLPITPKILFPQVINHIRHILNKHLVKSIHNKLYLVDAAKVQHIPEYLLFKNKGDIVCLNKKKN